MTGSATADRVDRRVFVADLIAAIPTALVVSGLGSPTWDVFAAGDRDENFYLWGAMGGAACVGLGLALAQPDRPVVVVTGDGEALMGLGSLATVGVQRPPNLTVVVLDNGHYGETGMQPSHTGLGVDLVGVARSCGIDRSMAITRQDEVADLAGAVNARAATVFCAVAIATDEPPRALPPRDGVHLKNRFRAALGLPTF
jgi:thiamine pyrophosphate-dependent acetolactate synthase large subunit-like protein